MWMWFNMIVTHPNHLMKEKDDSYTTSPLLTLPASLIARDISGVM